MIFARLLADEKYVKLNYDLSQRREKCPLSLLLPLSLSLSLFSYSLNSCCVSLFVIFVLFFHLALLVIKYFPACARSGQAAACLLPAPLLPPQSLSQSVSQQATAAGDNRSEACACLCPGLESPCQPEESGAIRNSLVASLARKFCYAAANLQQLP